MRLPLHVSVEFKPQDLWVGLYVDVERRRLYICVLPCLPIVIKTKRIKVITDLEVKSMCWEGGVVSTHAEITEWHEEWL